MTFVFTFFIIIRRRAIIECALVDIILPSKVLEDLVITCLFLYCVVYLQVFQFDMWNVKASDRYDWDALKEEVKT